MHTFTAASLLSIICSIALAAPVDSGVVQVQSDTLVKRTPMYRKDRGNNVIGSGNHGNVIYDKDGKRVLLGESEDDSDESGDESGDDEITMNGIFGVSNSIIGSGNKHNYIGGSGGITMNGISGVSNSIIGSGNKNNYIGFSGPGNDGHNYHQPPHVGPARDGFNGMVFTRDAWDAGELAQRIVS